MSKYITLEKIFDLQEKLIINNGKAFAPEYAFIKDCLELLINSPTDPEIIKKNKKKDICSTANTFYFAGRSSLITSTKLLLYGCPGDALACLRISWEAMTCVEYMVVFEAFDEFNQNHIVNKKGIKCSKLAKALDKKDNGGRVSTWKELSDYGSHISYSKLTIQQFKMNGKRVNRNGMGALDTMTAHNVSSRITQIALYMALTMRDFYQDYIKEALSAEFYMGVEQLSLRYSKFIDESKEKLKSLSAEIVVPSK